MDRQCRGSIPVPDEPGTQSGFGAQWELSPFLPVDRGLPSMPEPITAESRPAFIFDLDGTLIDSVYQHVLAWRQALESVGVDMPVWKIHRRIGMSGGLFVAALIRELDHPLSPEDAKLAAERHAEFFAPLAAQVRPLPGAADLLDTLTERGVPWAIATSGHMRSARHGLEMLGVLDGPAPIVTRDLVKYAKPDPDLFLAAAQKLGVDIQDAWVVGDSIWDLLAARRARALGIGLRSGGYGGDELREAGAFRVYNDPADLLVHLDEVGVRSPITE
jgi:HAD superfamily hydrolase (TIGR01509 family)